LDEKPGYSGVPNTLYNNRKTVLLFGDAKATLQGLSAALSDACSAREGA
ncbi:MAG: NAD(P)(+) transhydrogenase (Re/Si-specific) subunit beta, partial [Gaiellales bacterium]|nr:NAD(P)(+) transhydrogenase (Re/Si-specific) subunit beta [Gaiellales bacterium]